MLNTRNTTSGPVLYTTRSIRRGFPLQQTTVRSANPAQHGRGCWPYDYDHIMVHLVGYNIPISPVHSHGNIFTADWFQAWLSFLIIYSSPNMRQTPTRFYYLTVYYTELCFTPQTVQEFRGARQCKILHTHLRAAKVPPHDMRITKTAGVTSQVP